MRSLFAASFHPVGVQVTHDGVRTQRMSVVATLGGRGGYLLFSAANRFDRLYIRRRYWSDWTATEPPDRTRTNIVYDIDKTLR